MEKDEFIEVFKLTLDNGSYIELSNRGASWLSWIVPDQQGVLSDILLGYPTAEDYLYDTSYMGATIGRFANRISKASFTLNNQRYTLEKNDGENSNHGGNSGFHQRMWKGSYENDRVVFRLFSPHLQGGYPGNITLKVTYSYTASEGVTITYDATSDREAIVNLTNHVYFNLQGKGDILQHEIMIAATQLLETDAAFIPTGGIVEIAESEFDFHRYKSIGKDIHNQTPQLLWNRGYNHCYILSLKDERKMKIAAIVQEKSSGRKLTIHTTYPGVLFYSGGYLESNIMGKNGYCYTANDGFCLETQYFPDTPNHTNFPSCIVAPNRPYHHQTQYQIYI